MLKEIAIGIFAGSFYGLLGYAKSGERFNYKKFVRALIIGAAAGGYSFYAKISFNDASLFLSSAGITALVDFGLKAVWKRLERNVLKVKNLLGEVNNLKRADFMESFK
jgi:hypothetical protein